MHESFSPPDAQVASWARLQVLRETQRFPRQYAVEWKMKG